MPIAWRVSGPFLDEFVLSTRSSVFRPPPGAQRLHGQRVVWYLNFWFNQGSLQARHLLCAIAAEGSFRSVTPLTGDAELRAIVREAFDTGRLAVYRLARSSLRGTPPPPPRPTPPPLEPLPPPEPVEALTFIAFEVVHDDGTAAGGLEVEVELPDRTVRKGKLDGDGKWRIDQIPRGQCSVRIRAAGPSP